MKNLLIALLLLIGISSQAQVVTGLYSGTIFNDTTKMLQRYEVALSEYRGNITGYSYTTYVVNDTFYYGIRSIKAYKKDGILTIEDDKIIVNNFPELSKRVHRISTIPLTEVDTVTTLKGRWRTNKTKEYYAVHGSLEATRDNDSSQSALIGHLKELKLIPSGTASTQTGVAKTKDKEDKQKIKAEPAKESKRAASVTPAASIAQSYHQRQNKVLQTVQTASDSISLSFYDNGVVDGDIISVYLNGTNVIEKALLKEVAVKKSVALPKDGKDVELLLVAETLGSLPPNTGLLIINDGTNRYEVRFSADLQTNASIIIKKRTL
jgi:hypothetical protein